ncbi:MAG TPA: 2-amino-4-hydroxy-6-hydroxymethyldihydropteridine diphosphokinase [Spirochaetota bacterium]|nr:2-amino-4-hydroxy-6-hydroxymethyldihydropteridine diphosphokinase [Spirochaetota bacterium]HPJ35039.1 2-amino-4-hydroxy-6-hydroxymethyldihydropteridine diphosphokinase [Spirochaetota bacterium]
MASVYIGLGSNLGDRDGYLSDAVRMIINEIPAELVAESSVLETAAVDYTEQPDFLNQVILIKTDLPPEDLLKALKKIERKLGRVERFSKGPREIDLDILLYDDLVMNTETLVIPHPEIRNREFVIKHLAELSPELKDPVRGGRYSELIP